MEAGSSDPAVTPFSLFDGDFLNRTFSAMGLQGRRARDLFGRSIAVIAVTWLPMALFALNEGLVSAEIEARNFFADYAAYAQFLIALPLFIVAERVVSRNTREAAEDFLNTGVVNLADVPAVDAAHREVRRLRLAWLPEVVCALLAWTLAYFTFAPEFSDDTMVTWHTQYSGANRSLTWTGGWAMLVALPVLNYWWLRLAWKIVIWTRYLWRMSRLDLVLVAAHPDRTGGIGFISEVQAKFALVLFAYGISNVAATIAYQVAIQDASLTLPPVWGPALGFVICAPLLFLVPLFMFTKQLFRTKRRSLTLYREQATRHALAFEARWLATDAHDHAGAETAELTNLNNVATMFDRVEHMRVVPFDLRSASQLVASTLGSVATVLPLLRIEGPLKVWLEILTALLKRS
jgi:hypothetical protein